MTWWTALPATLATVAVFWLPGAALLAAVGVRGLRLAALAPAATAAVLGAGALLSPHLGIAWGLGPAAVLAVALPVVLRLALTRRRPRDASVERPGPASGPPVAGRARWALPLAVVVAVAVQLIPIAVGMGRPNRVQNAWDALYHLAALQQVRSGGGADPQALNELFVTGTGYYPHGWHAVAGVVPTWGGPVAVTNIAAFVPCALATALSVAMLARALFTGDRVTPVTATLLVGSGVTLPVAIALQPGLIPNAFGLALVPAALALAVDAVRADSPDRARLVAVLVLASGGIALVHPSAAAALALLAIPWIAPPALRALRRSWRHRLSRLLGIAAGLAAVLAMVIVITSRPFGTVASIRTGEPVSFGALSVALLTGDLGPWANHPLLPTLLALGGAVVLSRRRSDRKVAVALCLAVFAYSLAALRWEPLAELTAPWYAETRRLAPVVGIVVVVIAGWVLAELARRATARLESPGVGRGTAAAVLTGLVITVTVVPSIGSLTGLSRDTFSQDLPATPQAFDRKPYLTAAEESLVERLAERLDHDALMLGSSYSGAAHLAALSGQRVVQPYHSVPLDESASYVSEHLGDIGSDPGVCQAVRLLGARYVYVDPYPLHLTHWTELRPGSFTVPPPYEPLDSGGSATVYSLDVCYP